MSSSSSESSTTGSFQNQPTQATTSGRRKQTRKRRLGVLTDATNILEHAERTCKDKAVSNIARILTRQAPRGDTVAAGVASGLARASQPEKDKEMRPAKSDSLCQIVRHTPDIYEAGKEYIEEYIAKNAAFDMQKAFAIRVFTTAVSTWGKGILEACTLASEVTGFSAECIRRWASSYFIFIGSCPGPLNNLDRDVIEQELLSDRGTGSGNQSLLIHDEEFKLKAREFVRKNTCKKGEPNLTAHTFQVWIESTYSVTVCDETARVWLHLLGFSQQNHQKGVFFDGHDREDVVKYRTEFLNKLEEYDELTKTPNGPTPLTQPGTKPLIRIVHDESTFYANADQTHFWADGQIQVLRQKSLGQAIMVSDFIVEGGGYLRDEGGEARLLLETHSEGYFNNDKFLEQVDMALDIFDRRYPQYKGIFMFDNAPCHKKVADDALCVEHMNVNPGGKQPKMRDATGMGRCTG